MEKLREYLNSLNQEQQKSFASACNTSVEYLRKAISKKQKLGPVLSVLIEIHSGNAVTRQELHPTDWVMIWPELNTRKNLAV